MMMESHGNLLTNELNILFAAIEAIGNMVRVVLLSAYAKTKPHGLLNLSNRGLLHENKV
jgi:hypothetical protein